MSNGLFLVVEDRLVPPVDEMYRVMMLPGASYDEAGLRRWVNQVWRTPMDAPLVDLARAAEHGGWKIFQLL